jgi:hypothetical protein
MKTSTVIIILAVIIGGYAVAHVLFQRLQFGFYAADRWPQIENDLSVIEGKISESLEALEAGNQSQAKEALRDAQKQVDRTYRVNFADSQE